MPRFFVLDSGNTARQVKRFFVVDSGNVARQIKRLFVVDSGNVARLVYQSATTFTITVGQSGSQWGYAKSVYGSISSVVNLPAGLTITQVVEEFATFDVLQVTGFGSNPGINWLNTITDLGTGVTQIASSATYSYSGSAATWQWSPAWGIPHSIGTPVNFQMVLT